jgi:hypothetical protein
MCILTGGGRPQKARLLPLFHLSYFLNTKHAQLSHHDFVSDLASFGEHLGNVWGTFGIVWETNGIVWETNGIVWGTNGMV